MVQIPKRDRYAANRTKGSARQYPDEAAAAGADTADVVACDSGIDTGERFGHWHGFNISSGHEYHHDSGR